MPKTMDIAFFSFNGHQHLLIQGLKQVIKHVPNFRNIILVWDDYLRISPIDFQQVEQEVSHPLKIVKHTDLDPWPKCIGEWGWIKQQLVKLRCMEYSDADYVWICDGDVMIINDPVLFINDKPVLRYDSYLTRCMDYVGFIEKYFGINEFDPNQNWVGSTCLFDTEICREIFDTCLSRNNRTLIECVVEAIEQRTSDFPFSEFDLYGSFCYNKYRDKFFVTEKNWNYAPSRQGLTFPIQIMWYQFFPKNLNRAKDIACTFEHLA